MGFLALCHIFGRVINDMSSTGVGRVLKAVAHPLPTYIYKRSREILYREVEYTLSIGRVRSC
uniref:Uncharacterized protein n=1 Tax=Picea sitchensis TaxID=3332 RepID=A0A6B9XRV3_PICSI|nr:hypothetical protein Q903MT_gene5423 [Picea sitchensis]